MASFTDEKKSLLTSVLEDAPREPGRVSPIAVPSQASAERASRATGIPARPHAPPSQNPFITSSLRETAKVLGSIENSGRNGRIEAIEMAVKLQKKYYDQVSGHLEELGADIKQNEIILIHLRRGNSSIPTGDEIESIKKEKQSTLAAVF